MKCISLLLGCQGFFLGKITWGEGMLSEPSRRVRRCKGVQNLVILLHLKRKSTLPIAV
jgi:hypothetical protein